VREISPTPMLFVAERSPKIIHLLPANMEKFGGD